MSRIEELQAELKMEKMLHQNRPKWSNRPPNGLEGHHNAFSGPLSTFVGHFDPVSGVFKVALGAKIDLTWAPKGPKKPKMAKRG